MEAYELLEEIRNRLDDGDHAGAMGGLLEAVAGLMDQVDTLNMQLETLLEALGDQEEGEEEDDCSYLVTCEGCQCMIEVEAWLLEDETAELSCPKCGRELVL